MDFSRVAQLFEAALDRPKAGRLAWLAEACSDDPVTRAEVEEMLAAHERADGVLDRPIQALAKATLAESSLAGAPELSGGRYQLLGEIGRGGMGVVYKAYDPQLDRHVALKFLPPELRADEVARARFLAEARAASALDHPNICTIYDIGEALDGRVFIVMAYYEGDTLKDLIEAGEISVATAVDIAIQIAAGLGRAHEAKILHRDIKPSNIIVTPHGEARILDFGVAKLERGETLTQPETFVGTPAYMSPEQLLGESVDQQADIWALGVVLYEMLTGRRPFVGDRAAVLRAIVRDEPSRLAEMRADLPEELDRVVGKLLAKSPQARYARAGEVIDELAALRTPGAASDVAAYQRRAPIAGNLPTSLTSFVGREAELAEMKDIFTGARLLTLTGPAGTGKTRLAVRVAEEIGDDFADGVCFAPLASLVDSALVAPAIAQAVGLAGSSGTSVLEQLKTNLANRRQLLVLDNMEQVMRAAPLIAELLESCPGLKVMVTSRIALRLSGEHEYPVPALSVPDPAVERDLAALGDYSAVSLFIDRARAAKPDFALTDQNADAVIELCRKLDGLPLAIELAAARIKLLTPKAMVARLGKRLDLLKGGPRERPARQQTLREALAWSYALLEEREQRLFRRVSVFVGGFSLEAAQAVCGTAAGAAIELVDGLAVLVDHSLLRSVETGDEEPRFTMLETIQAYGVESLSLTDELGEVRRAHAMHFLQLAERAEPELTGLAQGSWLKRLDVEHDNLRAALAWAEESGEVDIGLRLGAALWRYWLVRSHMNEGRRALERSLAMPGGSSAYAARALNGLGTIAHNQGDNLEARAVLEKSLSLFRQLGDRRGVAAVLNNLSWVACELCDFETTKTLAEEALELCRALGDKRGCALALNNLGWIANYRGEQKSARVHHEESLALRREIGDHRGVAFALCNLAWSQQMAGEYEAAKARLMEAESVLLSVEDATLQAWMLALRARIAHDLGEHESALQILEGVRSRWREGGNRSVLVWGATSIGEIELARGNVDRASELLTEGLNGWKEIGSTFGAAIALLGLGETALATGDTERAVRLMQESLSIRQALADKRGTAECLESLSRIAVAQSRFRLAARLLGCADALRESLGAPLPPAKQGWRESIGVGLLSELGQSVFDSEWLAGRQTEFENTLALASGLSGVA